MPELIATEQRNPATIDLDLRSSREVIDALMQEDVVALGAAQATATDLATAVDRALERTTAGGRVHYFGAGASGRLAVLDATEATPTFGVPPGFFVPHFPGGAEAFMDSRIDHEDAEELGHDDAVDVQTADVVVGITASGSTSYVRGALRRGRDAGALTVLITCNPASPLAELADVTVAPDTGAEALTGSTRLKAGTASSREAFAGLQRAGWQRAGWPAPKSGVRRMKHARALAAAIRANAAMSMTSPRAVGSTPAASRQRSASGAPPAQPASAARRVLRRCANAASTTANTCSRVAVVAGGSRRVKATRPEWIFGAGQKTFMPMTPALRMWLYQAAFTDGTP